VKRVLFLGTGPKNADLAVMEGLRDARVATGLDDADQVIDGRGGRSGGGNADDEAMATTPHRRNPERTPLTKTRSLSDGGGTQLSPSPHIIEASRRASKDDSALRDPVTPRRPEISARGLSLSLQMPYGDSTSPAPGSTSSSQLIKPALTPTPLSPKLDHSQIYASPTNILPRRSRGLDFSRAATSLHHSTLAEQASPDSSPTIGGRGMNIPGRGSGEFNEDGTNSLWSMMGTQERMNISSSLGSTNVLGSDSSSSSDDDFMDEDMEDAIMSTPQAARGNSRIGTQTPVSSNNVVPWMPETSPAVNSLSSFRARQPRRQTKKKLRGLAALGFNAAAPATFSKSPPTNASKEKKHSRRESISWAANQLHISGSADEERSTDTIDAMSTPSKEGQRGVVKRVVTRRGNLLVSNSPFWALGIILLT
jgi:hypothetical protein